MNCSCIYDTSSSVTMGSPKLVQSHSLSLSSRREGVERPGTPDPRYDPSYDFTINDLDLQVGAVGEPISVDLGVSGEVDGAAEEIGDDGLASVVSGDGQVWPDGTARAGNGRAASEKGSAAAGRPLPFAQSFSAGL